MTRTAAALLHLVFNFILLSRPTASIEHCLNGQVCPDENTCCSGGCIASDLGRLNATCCSDGITGCGVGYLCGSDGDCIASDLIKDPLVQRLHRYQLCHPKRNTLETLHGFSVDDESGINRLAYYSSHGNIETVDMASIDFVLVVIHGANRNADDYYCAATAAVELQSTFPSVLVVAPRFATPLDGPFMLHQGGTALRWVDEGSGPWRYGAKSVYPVSVSSFAATDLLVGTLLYRTRHNVPLVMFGHSSGGQFVQRWSLLTKQWSEGRMRAVAANPSSYAYLTPLRKLNGDWKVPSSDLMSSCPNYNEWEWGLENTETLDDEYKRNALAELDNSTEKLIDRFRERDLTYLVGSQDRCNVSEVGWCDSHGLETHCMDELQGSMRFERHSNYFESLHLVGIDSHRRAVVKGVGHDHSVILTRPEGIQAIFQGISGSPAVDVDYRLMLQVHLIAMR